MSNEPIWKPVERPSEDEAERAGRDAATNGANTTNCHFRFFATRELTTAWERGNKDARRTPRAKENRVK